MIWVNGVNIINQAADSHAIIRAFERTPFKVVVDAFFTDTAERADLVLPSTLMLEQEDIIGSFLHEYVQYVNVVCNPPEGVKDDYTILTELGKRLNPPILLPDFETCLKTALETPFLDVSLEAIRENHFTRAHRPSIPYADMRFDHSDGKYRFPITIHSEPISPDGFPLRLLTLVRRDVMHSQILPDRRKELPKAWISPECPVWSQLDEDKNIYLISPKGKLRVHLKRLPGLHPETVLYRRGDWMKFGGGVNQIIEAGLTDMGNGAAFYDQYVRLENG
jgi:anaerobic selenocysteine-containing dehydrogenase